MKTKTQKRYRKNTWPTKTRAQRNRSSHRTAFGFPKRKSS